MGLNPRDVWDMRLWEFNAWVKGYERAQNNRHAECILTGYYCAYYVNGRKGTKPPNELISRLFRPAPDIESGLKEIQKIKQYEKGGI